MNRRVFSILAVAASLAAARASAAARGLGDDAITDDVRMKLAGDPIVKGGELSVQVYEGVVTLSGSVASPQARTRAQSDAHQVRGVKRVVNNIQLR